MQWKSNFCVQTSEAERIGVNQVAKVLPSGKASGTEQCTLLLSNAQLLHACASAHGSTMSLEPEEFTLLLSLLLARFCKARQPSFF